MNSFIASRPDLGLHCLPVRPFWDTMNTWLKAYILVAGLFIFFAVSLILDVVAEQSTD